MPELNQIVADEHLGSEHYFGRRIPASSSCASFVAAVAAEHAAGGGTVHVVTDTPINTAVTVPSDVRVVIEHGAQFVKQTGGSLTFDGSFEAPLSQVFSGFAAGDVLLSLPKVYPEWWGAKADCSGVSDGTDSYTALQCALSAATSTSKLPEVLLGPGGYRSTQALTCSIGTGTGARGVTIRGAGRKQTLLVFDGTSSTDGLVYSSSSMYGQGGGIRDLKIQASDAGQEGFGSKSRDLLVVVNWDGFQSDSADVEYAGRYCLRHSGCIACTFRDTYFNWAGSVSSCIGADTYGGGVPLGTTTNFLNCLFNGGAHQSCLVKYSQLDTSFFGCTFQSSGRGTDRSTGHGLELWDGFAAAYSCYFENNSALDVSVGYVEQNYIGADLIVTHPHCFRGSYSDANSGGLRFWMTRASSVIGGYFAETAIARPIVLGPDAINGTEIIAFPENANPPVCWTPGAVYLPLPQRVRAKGTVTAAPTVGTWKAGTILWYTSPAASGAIGVVCLADGTPGTWAEFGPIAPYTFPVVGNVTAAAGTTLQLTGEMADGASAIGVQIVTPAYANAAAQLLSIVRGSSEVCYFGRDGQFNMGAKDSETAFIRANGTANFGGVVIGGDGLSKGGATPITLLGNQADGATSNSLIVDTAHSFTIEGSKLLSVKNAAEEKFSVGKDGDPRVGGIGALPTASGTYHGALWTVYGANDIADATYQCLKGADNNYTWKLIVAG